ncbi:MAG: hypothetical protein K5866_06955 [Treponema sp.]|nr:hypothetical protein [Treponema sp.]
MTIKVRTKFTFAIFVISVITFFIYLSFLIYEIATSNLKFPQIYFSNQPKDNLIFGYNYIVILSSVFIELFYVMLTTFMIYRGFIKTQSSIVLGFLIFTLAIYMDTFRIFIPFFHISNSFSRIQLLIGNVTLFARILATLSILMTAILHFDEQTTNVNRYCIVLIFLSMLLATIIPLNTTKILPDFLVAHSYSRTIRITSIALSVLSFLSVLIRNYTKETKQLTSVGFFMVCLGYQLLFYSYSLFFLSIAFLLMGVGSGMFLHELHKEYMWK